MIPRAAALALALVLVLGPAAPHARDAGPWLARLDALSGPSQGEAYWLGLLGARIAPPPPYATPPEVEAAARAYAAYLRERQRQEEQLAALPPDAGGVPPGTAPPSPSPSPVGGGLAARLGLGGRYLQGYLSETYDTAGCRRTDCVHVGTDVHGAVGTPVTATASGVVVAAPRGSPLDTAIIVKGSNGRYQVYGHVAGLGPGDRVAAGQPVGRIVQGPFTPHVHYGEASQMPGTGGCGWGRCRGADRADAIRHAQAAGWVNPSSL